MDPEFSIAQIRAFVTKGYTSVAARYVKAMLQHYDNAIPAINPYKSIHIKDLQKGDYLVNHGLVEHIEEYLNCFVVQANGTTHGLIFSKSQSVIIQKT